MHYCQIQRNFRDSEYLCKLGKEYLNHCYASFILFSRQNLQTFEISHAFLPLTIVKLSTFKSGPVFLAHPVLSIMPKWEAERQHHFNESIDTTDMFYDYTNLSNNSSSASPLQGLSQQQDTILHVEGTSRAKTQTVTSFCTSTLYCKTNIFRVHQIFANFASTIKSQN